MGRAERLRIIAEVYQEWETENATRVKADPQYAVDGPSQYPDGIVPVSATPEMEADFIRRLGAAAVFTPTPPSKE